MHRVSAGDERLGGRAPRIDARAAEELAFNNGYLLARGCKTPRQRRTGLPGPDDDRVIILHRCEPRLICWIPCSAMSGNRVKVGAVIPLNAGDQNHKRSATPRPHAGERAIAPD